MKRIKKKTRKKRKELLYFFSIDALAADPQLFKEIEYDVSHWHVRQVDFGTPNQTIQDSTLSIHKSRSRSNLDSEQTPCKVS